MYYINTLPLIPLRASDSEQSELGSQILYGEQIEILETKEKWLYVKNMTDGYEGWISKNMVDKKTFTEKPKDITCFSILNSPTTTLVNENGEKLLLTGGSLISETNSSIVSKENKNIIKLATQYLNTPYLWGGKSAFGIDCSGFTQVIFSMVGIKLPRNASQQVELGTVVNFLEEVKEGDLAFFENEEGKIVHVGILINNHKIIHASGFVKMDTIDNQGIISSQTGEYTHKLRVIKRI